MWLGHHDLAVSAALRSSRSTYALPGRRPGYAAHMRAGPNPHATFAALKSAPTLGLRPVVTLVLVSLLSGCASSVTPSPPPATPVVTPVPRVAVVAPTVPAMPTVPATPTAAAMPTATPRASPTVSPLPTTGVPADDGARIVRVTTVDARTRDLTIVSPALGWPSRTPYAIVKVRLLLPSQFDAQPAARWPVLFLLCGSDGNHTEWAMNTDVEKLTAPTDLLVVMPDAGGGWYSNWWNSGKGGPPEWETFHLVELRQLLDRNWHAGDRRAIAGQSMGGLGAMNYAAAHPGMFLAAASFSGVLDPVGGHARGWQPEASARVWGELPAQAGVWTAHDPTDHTAALRGTTLYVAYGNGQPGPLDARGAPADPQESEVATESQAFVSRLATQHIPVIVDAYGNGTHSWPYFQLDLHRSLPFLMKALHG
jgi:diacylglycerol O-acyltransferase / trehalose O-mycolyltransferase